MNICVFMSVCLCACIYQQCSTNVRVCMCLCACMRVLTCSCRSQLLMCVCVCVCVHVCVYLPGVPCSCRNWVWTTAPPALRLGWHPLRTPGSLIGPDLPFSHPWSSSRSPGLRDKTMVLFDCDKPDELFYNKQLSLFSCCHYETIMGNIYTYSTYWETQMSEGTLTLSFFFTFDTSFRE